MRHAEGVVAGLGHLEEAAVVGLAVVKHALVEVGVTNMLAGPCRQKETAGVFPKVLSL